MESGGPAGGSAASRTVGMRVAHLRRARGITLSRLASRLDVEIAVLQKVENGELEVTLHGIVRLANALGIDPSVLVGGLRADDVPDGASPGLSALAPPTGNTRDGTP